MTGALYPDNLADLRSAAERSWGDDTRHENFAGHPRPCVGQCYVTSRWVQSHLGGHIGLRDGHYFWVSPDRSHVVDLTGDKHYPDSAIPTEPIHVKSSLEWAPGPILYERADHPNWKGMRVVSPIDTPRSQLFAKRADTALMGHKTAEGNASGSDPYPGETSEKVEQMDSLNLHDEPGYEPDPEPQTFNFVFANGQVHVSPHHDHEQLLGHAGSSVDSEGPVAVGDVTVRDGHAMWRVESNVGLAGLRDALVAYSHQVGWKFDGQVGTDGQPMGLDLGPVMSFWYRVTASGENVEVAHTPMRYGRKIYVSGGTAYVDKIHPGLVDWANDFELRLAEYPGPTQLWHHALPQDRDSIQRQGILPLSPEEDGSHRVYLSEQPVYDVHRSDHWAVDPIGLDLKPVLRNYDQQPIQGWYYVNEPVRGALTKTAEYPGGGNMLDKMKVKENLDTFNRGDTTFQPERDNLDATIEGPFVCKNCQEEIPTLAALRLHMRGHEPHEEEIQDGHFPQVQDFDEPLGFGTQSIPNSGETIAKVASFFDSLPPWNPGNWGKGMMVDGNRVTWSTDHGAPHHEDIPEYYEDQYGGYPDSMQSEIVIHPSGYYTHAYGQASPQERENASAFHGMDGLKFVQDGNRWQQLTDRWDRNNTFSAVGIDPIPDGHNTIAMVLANDYEAHRMPEFEGYSDFYGFDDKCLYYGAYRNGEMLGVGVMQGSEVLGIMGQADDAILEHMKRHHASLYAREPIEGLVNVAAGLWRYSKGNEPKDMIEDDIPFVWDIADHRLEIGYAGSSTHDVRIPGKFTPGGIVEGYYQPGGKVVVQTASSLPHSLYALWNLWYHKFPQMEITSLEQMEPDGSKTKLASLPPGGTEQGFLYRGTDPQHREVIQREGMHPSPDDGYLFMTDHPEYAREYGGDLWRIDTKGLDAWESDPEYHNWMVQDTHIPPERLTLMNHQSKLAAEEDPTYIGNYIHSLVKSDLPANNAYEALKAAGGTVSVVGGAIRDALQGKVPNDLDLLVQHMSPVDVEHTLDKLTGVVNLTGKNFGVYRYRTGGSDVEVALPRTDSYESGKRSEGKSLVDPDLPLDKDLERRDFTVNSMAIPLDTRELVDPHGGAKDIERGVLRTTHPDSFREDPTRLIRALTAHGRFGLNPDERTRHEMEDNAWRLGERRDLNPVLEKLMKSPNPAGAIRLAHETGMLGHLFPEVENNWDFDQNNAHHNYTLGEHLMHVLDNTSRLTTDPDVRMAALYHDVGKPASEWKDTSGVSHYYRKTGDDIGVPYHFNDDGSTDYDVAPDAEWGWGANHEKVGAQMAHDRMNALGYPDARARRDRIEWLIKRHMFAPFSTVKGARKFIQDPPKGVGNDHADDLLNLREADQTGKGQTPEEVQARTSADQMREYVNQARNENAPTGISSLSVNGNDLIRMGLTPGPQVGVVLRQLSDDVVEDPMLNQRDSLMQRAQEYVNAQPQGATQ